MNIDFIQSYALLFAATIALLCAILILINHLKKRTNEREVNNQ